MIQRRREVTYLLTKEAKGASERACNSASEKPRSTGLFATYTGSKEPQASYLFAVSVVSYHSLFAH